MIISRTFAVVVVVLVLLLLCGPLYGFNVDVRSHVKYSRPTGSMFGFAVAAHKEGDTGW